MTTHFCTYGFSYAAAVSNASSVDPQALWGIASSSVAIANTTDPIATTNLDLGRLQTCFAPNGGLSTVFNVEALITGATTGVICRAKFDDEYWAVNGTYRAQTAGNDAIARAAGTGGKCRTNPDFFLSFIGPSATALLAASGALTLAAAVPVQIVGSKPIALATMTQTMLGEFDDDPPDGATTGVAKMGAILRNIAGSSDYVLGVQGATTHVARQCNFAGISPAGEIYIRPEDVGAGAGQITSGSNVNNTAATFRLYPGVFMRRTNYVRGIQRMTRDATAINVAGATQPLTILSVTSAITFSDWLVIVDGVPAIVRLNHPANTDYRRARDIWNNVWVPIITGSQSPISASTFASIDGIQTVGAFVADRLKYMTYARMLTPNNTSRIIQGGV